MPYRWSDTSPSDTQELHLWPHQSMTPRGFVLFIGVTFALLLLPLFALLGTIALWGLLPFLMIALAGVWLALNTSQRRAQVLEILILTKDTAHLTRHNPRGQIQEWQSNRHWAQPELHVHGGPVPNYVTLRGAGRQVEIGAFLSEEERKSLFQDLKSRLA